MNQIVEQDRDLAGTLLAEDMAKILPGGSWSCEYARLDFASAERAELVYTKNGAAPLRVRVAPVRESDAAVMIAGGWWASVHAATDDPSLPGLSQALARVNDPQIIRYRPGKRCTFRGVLVDGRTVFVKTFAHERAADIWRDSLAIAAASAHAELAFAVAAPVWLDRETNSLALSSIPGANAAPLLCQDGGEALAGDIANALATIPRSGAKTAFRFTAEDQLARTSKYARKFRRAAPTLTPLIDDVVSALTLAHKRAVGERLRPVHGAPHPQQWLYGPAGLGLVDFDRFGLGPIELDAATFVAELDFEAEAGGGRNKAIRSFVINYRNAVGAFDDEMFMIYRTHKHVAKAFKASLAVRSDRIARAGEILTGALGMLREMAA